MKFHIVAAVDLNGAIGANGVIPWHAPADLAHFKRITTGQYLLLGRKTYATLPNKLEGRRLIVLTRSGKTPLPLGGEIVFDVGQVIVGFAKQASEIFIGGGAAVYRMTVPLAVTMHITVVHVEAPKADTYFPPVDLASWRVTERVERAADERNPALTFLTLERTRVDPVALNMEQIPEVGFWKAALSTLGPAVI